MEKQVYITEEERAKCKKVAEAFTELYEMADIVVVDVGRYGFVYITRQSVHKPANVRKCKAAIKKAFQRSMDGKGFSLVEVVSTCNSGWKLSPVASNEWLEQNMLPFYPLGDIKVVE